MIFEIVTLINLVCILFLYSAEWYICIDENLPNYFDALGGPTLGKLIKEEIDIRRDYGFRTIMDSTLMGILNAHPACRVIQGVGFYDMLYNDKYKEKFQYFHYVGETKQSLMELDWTKVKLTLSIAFEKERSESVSNFVSNCNADKQLLGRIENSNGIFYYLWILFLNKYNC